MIFALYPLLFFAQEASPSSGPTGLANQRITFEVEGDMGITEARYDITVELENAGRVVQAEAHLPRTGETEGLVFGLLLAFGDHGIRCGIEENTLGLAAKSAEDLVIPNPWRIASVRVEQLDSAHQRHLTAWVRQSSIGFVDRLKPDHDSPVPDGFTSFDLAVLDYTGEGVEIALAFRRSSERSTAEPEPMEQISKRALRTEGGRELAVLVAFAKKVGLVPSSLGPDGRLHVETRPGSYLTEVAFALKQRSSGGTPAHVLQYSLNAQ